MRDIMAMPPSAPPTQTMDKNCGVERGMIAGSAFVMKTEKCYLLGFTIRTLERTICQA